MRWLLDWLGGAVGRVAGTGLVGGAVLILSGMSAAELVAYIFKSSPAWLLSGWTRLLLVIVGLALTFVSVRFNVWSQRQKAIDDLSEDLSWAIHNLLNRPVPGKLETHWIRYNKKWEQDFKEWCLRVSTKLANRAFFTLSDQLHFDRLGFVDSVKMSESAKHNHLLSMLKLKFDRLRDVINWAQQRPR